MKAIAGQGILLLYSFLTLLLVPVDKGLVTDQIVLTIG